MIITPGAITALFTAFKANFQKAQEEAKPMYLEVATLVPSTSKSNTYGWLGKVPSLREWIGERVINSIKAFGYTITNKDWESTVSVDRNDIEDDEVGVYSPLFQEMGRAAAIHPDEIVFPLLRQGFTSLCFDGQNFFDGEHPVMENADGTGQNTPTSNMKVDAGYTGEPWYLLDTTRAIKPLIFQQRKKPVFTNMTKMDDESVFMSKEFRFGVDCRDEVGFSFWQMAYGIKADLSYDNLWEVYSAMRAFTADGGRKLGMRPKTLVVPTSLEKQAKRIVNRERLDNGESNELYQMFKIITPDYL